MRQPTPSSLAALLLMAAPALAAPALALAAEALRPGTRAILVSDGTGAAPIRVGALTLAPADANGESAMEVTWVDALFGDHFLSMRPFKCLEGPEQLWCRAPYPYDNRRKISATDLTDLEYDLLFVWKPKGAYGIDLWNGVYYRLSVAADGTIAGELHDFDMNPLGVPPEAGNLRPLGPDDLTPGPDDGRWLPRIVIQ